MLSLYEILKASKTGIAPDMWTALAGKNWGGADSGHEVKELTGIPPLSFTADGTPLLDYLISGNTVQNGTGTPDSPVMPEGCGDLEATGEHAGQYKIPILSGGVTTNIYLGSTQTVRKIKKLVLDGTESTWMEYNNLNLFRVPDRSRDYRSQVGGALCDSLPLVARGDLTANSFCWSTGTIGEFIININNYNLADLKAYLSSNPITIWYVLATPETAVVNEPLMKIGGYADTLSMEQAGVQIPTLHGNTVIDVLTDVKPSEMYIKYQE